MAHLERMRCGTLKAALGRRFPSDGTGLIGRYPADGRLPCGCQTSQIVPFLIVEGVRSEIPLSVGEDFFWQHDRRTIIRIVAPRFGRRPSPIVDRLIAIRRGDFVLVPVPVGIWPTGYPADLRPRRYDDRGRDRVAGRQVVITRL